MTGWDVAALLVVCTTFLVLAAIVADLRRNPRRCGEQLVHPERGEVMGVCSLRDGHDERQHVELKGKQLVRSWPARARHGPSFNEATSRDLPTTPFP